MKSGVPQDEIDKLFATAVELHRQGHLPQAESLYRTLLAVDPGHADSLHLLGVLAHQRGEHATAAEHIGKAIGINRRVPQYHFNRGVALQALADNAEAAECYRRAVRLKADYAAAWENLGVALQDLGDLDSARAAYAKALSIDPRAVLAHQNLGTLLLNLGQIGEAQEHFRAVLKAHPAHAEARSKHATTLLSQGKYQEGWEEYEWRLYSPSFTEFNPPRVVPFPKWDGSSLTGKTLLINPEQGIGEELMFASCYEDVIAQAERCLIECDPRLSRLFARSFPTATIVPSVGRFEDFSWTASLPHVDFRISAASLPRFCRNSAGDFPAVSSYLRVDDTQRAQWRRVLAALGKRYNIGISWIGGRDPRSAKARSIPLAEWQPIFAAVDASFVNLQYGQHEEEIAQFHRGGLGQLHTLPGADALRDPDGFMALIAELDLVISIDNSTVFMAGAVGTPVWILLPSSAEWRWQGAGERTPWYPRATLHRQREPGIDAWRTLIGEVAPRLPRYLDGLATRSETSMAQDDSGASSPGSILSPGDTRATERGVLLNDTRSWYHWGCSCTSLALHSRLRQRHRRVDSLAIHRLLQCSEAPRTAQELDDDALFERFCAAHGGLIAGLRDADTVYINGEGTLHGASTQALTLLYLAYIAKVRLQRRVHIINHSCYPEDSAAVTDSPVYDLYRQVYRQMDFVAVREAVSARVLADMGIEACESFDCLPLFLRAHKVTPPESTSAARKVVIAGSVAWGSGEVARSVGDLIVRLHSSGHLPIVLIGADAYPAEDDARFVSILQQTAGGCFRLVNATSELEWLRTIADAALLVSGRFHHSIAAAFLDTPFIVMESNTPKIAGLLERLESKSFLSVMQPRLSEVLEERARQMLASPRDYLITGEVKERLELLAERNFSTRA